MLQKFADAKKSTVTGIALAYVLAKVTKVKRRERRGKGMLVEEG